MNITASGQIRMRLGDTHVYIQKKKDSYLAVDKLAYVLEKNSNDQQ